YSYAEHMAQLDKDGSLDHLDFEYLRESGSAVVGDPDRCVELAERYQAAGCDLLLCLVNPYKIPHEQVMRSIELLGERVIPQFDKQGNMTAHEHDTVMRRSFKRQVG